MKSVYLDHAAATPLDQEVLTVMQPYFSGQFYNPSAIYLPAKAVRLDVEQARSEVAQILGARPSEIIWTAGGTEANNLAIAGVLQSFPGAHAVTTALEHDSVRYPMQFWASKGWSASEVLPAVDGIVSPQAVADAVTEETVLVSVMYANNEIGTIQPIRDIAQVLQGIREQRRQQGNDLPLYLHTDACQAANYLSLQVHRLGVDLMTVNGGKIYGPKQSGFLYASAQVQLTPLIHGGGQEAGKRSGTENVPAILGFTEALKRAQAKSKTEQQRLQQLQKDFIQKLLLAIPSVEINGSRKHRLPNNVHITIPGTDNERLLFALDEAGIQAAAGSACSASSEESSHVLKSLGLNDEAARSSLRFTMGRTTTQKGIDYVVEQLANIVAG